MGSLVGIQSVLTTILGILVSVDGYMNIHLANTEEYIDGVNSGGLGEILIRYDRRHCLNLSR